MTEVTPPKKRWLLKISLAIVALVVLLVALAPTILSMGLVRGIARDAIAGAVNGDVQLASVSLGWFSDQSVEGLSVRDTDGSNKADVRLRVRGGLLSLLFSGGKALNASVSGSVSGTIGEDGSIGFAKMLKASGTTTTSSGGTANSSGGSSGATVATIAIDGLSVTMTDLRTKKSYALDSLRGTASVDTGKGTASAQLGSATTFAGKQGSIDIKASASNLGSGFQVGTIAADCAIVAKDLRVPAGDRDADFTSIEATLKSPGLAQSAQLVAKATGLVDGTTASTLNADLTVTSLFKSSGEFDFKPSNLQGRIEAANLPTSLVEPMLAKTNVRLSKDLGAIVDRLDVQLPGGAKPITVDLKSPKATLTASAQVNAETGAVGDGSINGTVDLSVESLQRLASVAVAKDIRLALSGSKLAWLPAGNEPALGRLVGQIEVRPLTPITWLDEQRKIAVALGQKTLITFGRATAHDAFSATIDAPVACGGSAAPPAAPDAPNVRATATLPAKLDAVHGATLSADLALDPAFMLSLSSRSFTKPVRIQANVRDLDLALPMDGIAGIRVDAELRIAGETGIYVEQVNRDIPLRDIVATVKSADLAKEAVVTLNGTVDTAKVAVSETVRGLPKDLAGIDALAMNVRGTAKIAGLNGDGLVAWMGEQRSLIEAARVKGLSIDLTNEPLPGKPGQRVTVALGGQPIAGTIVAGIERERASIDKLDLSGSLSRELLGELQTSRDRKVAFASDVPFTLALAQPTTFAYAELKAGKLPAGLAAHLTLAEVAVAEAPGLAAPIALRNVDATLEVDPSATSAKAKGSFNANGANAATDRIEGATFDLAWAKPTGPSLLQGLSGTARLAGINVPWVESLLGKSKGAISNWTGDVGSMTLTMNRGATGETVRIAPEFPRVTSGALDIVANGERVSATAKGVAIRVPAATLEGIAAKPGLPADAPRYGFQSDLSLTLSDATVDLPKALAKEGDPAAGAGMNVALAIEPLAVRIIRTGAPVETLSVPAIDATLTSKDIVKGITVTANDRGAVAGGPSFKISGGIRDLADDKGKFSTAAAVLDLDADVQQIPTVLLDLLASTNGSLTRSLGDRVSLKASAKGLSKTSGKASATLKSPFVDVNIPQLTVNKAGFARIVAEKPLTATFAMSPGIKDDILYSINTVFADIDLVKERGSLTVRDLDYPLDGNLAKLDADLTLDIGDIRMRNGKPVSIIFLILDSKPAAGSEGRIEPLVVKVNNGRMTYDNFGLKLFRQEGAAGAPPTWRSQFDMKGDIDLGKKYVKAITTRIPASQIGNYSGEVGNFLNGIGGSSGELAKSLYIDVTMYGPLYDEKGNFKELEKKIGLPKIEDVAKNPLDLAKDAMKLIPKKDAPAKDEPKAPAKDAPKAPPKDAPKDAPKEPAKDKPKKPAKDKPAAPPAAPPKS